MYIPDKIRIVAHGHKVEVFSLDEGHNPDEALPVAGVSIRWYESRPVNITVEYGSHIYMISEGPSSTVSVDYPYNRVVMDVTTGGSRSMKDAWKQ